MPQISERKAHEPLAQQAAFESHLSAEISDTLRDDPTFTESDISINVLRSEDLNGDGLLDFFIQNSTPAFCGSGGCGFDVYVAESLGESYTRVLSLLGANVPQTIDEPGAEYKPVLMDEYSVDGAPIRSVYRWDGATYSLSAYTFNCSGLVTELCGLTSITVTPIDKATPVVLPEDAPIHVAPDSGAQTIWRSTAAFDSTSMTVLGRVDGTTWYLVDSWKSYAGFVDSADTTTKS